MQVDSKLWTDLTNPSFWIWTGPSLTLTRTNLSGVEFSRPFGPGLSVGRTHECLLEGTARGVDKGSGVLRLLTRLNIPAERAITRTISLYFGRLGPAWLWAIFGPRSASGRLGGADP